MDKAEGSTLCIIQNSIPNSEVKRITLMVRPSGTISQLYRDVRLQLDITDFELNLKTTPDSEEIVLNETDKLSLKEVGVIFAQKHRNTIIVTPAVSLIPLTHTPLPAKRMLFNAAAEPPPAPVTAAETQERIARQQKALDMDELVSTTPPLAISAQPTSSEDFLIKRYLGTTNDNNNRNNAITNTMSSLTPTTSSTNDSDSTVGKLFSVPRLNYGYVGLVNQAMTCYLNSLLQALYMTPEFRNAMYKWVYDGNDEVKSIPYQLQILFLNLQTSTNSAVETTDLTKSFGWDSSEAWQQHDIQELCRVMFDALEQKFKATEQADLINRLYEGKMMDYVKCLECHTEKTREDTFLDIPLPVRQFGSAVAYESVEEALRAFVEPEILDGNNQYFCEKCNRKCDAHKGLKFTRFPYVLTLHLKRFDFDYQTFHRIKLNDKVTFPQRLNLNSFVKDVDAIGGFMQQQQQQQHQQQQQQQQQTQQQSSNGGTVSSATSGIGSASSEHGSVESAIKCDDCSTTDSESAIEEESYNGTNGVGAALGGVGPSGITNGPSGSGISNANNNDNDLQDDDEGIDMSTSTDTKSTISTSNDPGPYVYELFAIMIHSGSASGGHYYAYIKEFETNEWFCFNDQSVSAASQEDINRSFGGSTSKSYYSGAYSSSTNAYMLMYRQMDPQRNVTPIKADDFPDHIKQLLQRLESKKVSKIDIVKVKVYFWNPKEKKVKQTRVYMESDSTLTNTLHDAYEQFQVENFAPMDRCRIVAYNHDKEQITQSFDNADMELPLAQSTALIQPLEFLLEMRAESVEFERIDKHSVITKVFTVDLTTGDVDGSVEIRACGTVAEFKKVVAKKLGLNADHLVIALLRDNGTASVLKRDASTIALEDVQDQSKIFVASVETELDYNIFTKLTKIVEHFDHILTLYFVLPNTDKETLEKMSIPSFEEVPVTGGTPSPVYELKSNGTDSTSVDVVDAMMTAAPMSLNATFFTPVSYETTYTLPLPQQSVPAHTTSVSATATITSTGTLITSPSSSHVEPESNSEDSSLSDGDRTLIDSPPDIADLSSTNNSPACSDTQLSSPEYHTRRITDFDGVDDDTDMASSCIGKVGKLYFKAVYIEEATSTSSAISSGSSTMVSSTSEDIPSGNSTQRVLKVLVDQSMTLGTLKQAMEPFVKVPKEYFKIFRMSTLTTTETECTCLSDQMGKFKDGERLVIELGRALRKGEYKCKVYHLNLKDAISDDFERMPVLCEWILRNGADVGQTKREIIAHLATLDAKSNLTYDMCRLRRKNYKTPTEIYTDDQKFDDDIQLSENFEIILQEMDDLCQPYTNSNDNALFLRKWHPSTRTLDPFQEISYSTDRKNRRDLRTILAEVSNIPEERIEYVKLTGTFPRYNGSSPLTLHTQLKWTSAPLYTDSASLLSGLVWGEAWFYRDKDEQLKDLSPAEHTRLHDQERKSSSAKLSYAYTTRRERGLRICVAESPKKHDYD